MVASARPTLAEVYPRHVRKFYDRTFRSNPDPAKVSAGTDRISIHWKCPTCHHRWSAPPHQITKSWRKGHTGCPKCGGKIRVIADDYRRLASERGLTWLGPLPPTVHDHTNWRCSEGHEWPAAYSMVRSGTGCRRCYDQSQTRRRPGRPEYNLLTEYPAIAALWHPTKNKKGPECFTPQSNRVANWLCPRGHETRIRIQSKVLSNGSCSKCNRKSSRWECRVFAELKYLFPDALHQPKVASREVDVAIPSLRLGIEIDGWHHRKTADKDRRKNAAVEAVGMTLLRLRESGLPRLKPIDVIVESNQELQISDLHRLIRSLAKAKTNLLTAEQRRKVSGYLSRTTWVNQALYDDMVVNIAGPPNHRSLAARSPELSSEWDYKKNAPLTPRDVYATSTVAYWWLCRNGHSSRRTPNERQRGGRGFVPCQQCPKPPMPNSRRRRGVPNPKWAKKFSESLAAKFPAIAREFHPTLNPGLDPSKLLPNSGYVVYWTCPTSPSHDYPMRVVNRTRGSQKCPYCAGKRLAADMTLAFLDPELAKEWDHERNLRDDRTPIAPNEVGAKDKMKRWWRCVQDSSHPPWQATVYDRFVKRSGCQKCYHARRRRRRVPKLGVKG